jgi:RNA polymerase sigma-54 factor
MKASLKFGLSQQLTLTPQLREAIRLLQLSATELETEVREALEKNPVLEMTPQQEVESASQPIHNLLNYDETSAPSRDQEHFNSIETPNEHESVRGDSLTDDYLSDPETPAYEWEVPNLSGDMHERTASINSSGDRDSDSDHFESREPAPESLTKHLLWQLHLTPWTARDRSIAEVIIGSLEPDGYLNEPPEVIRASLRMPRGPTNAEIEAIRARVQRFDPIGVASRTLKECLWVQLEHMASDTPFRALAQEMVANHLEGLARDPDRLSQHLGITRQEFDHAIGLIRSLRPRPGNSYNQPSTDYVIPDAYAVRHGSKGWTAYLNSACQPSLSINRHYERLAASAKNDAGNYLRGCLQEARWLIRSIQSRGETLLKTATCIVKRQAAFLECGPEAMQPLTLREVADEIGVHESTVSRITTRKYLHTPRGTFEFKHFFSVGLATAEGGEASAIAIRAMIRKLVEDECRDRPMSDSAIADELKRRGIAVARRTVAKYRESMSILPSGQRSRLA